MGWLSKVFGTGAGEMVEKIGGVAAQFAENHLGKKELLLEVERISNEQFKAVEETVRVELQAKERVIVAELAQGDNYTKRARPTIVYAGLLFILTDLVVRYVAHWSANPIPETQIPEGFWWAWSGVTGTWAVGRTVEKVAGPSRVSSAITGSKLGKLLD